MRSFIASAVVLALAALPSTLALAVPPRFTGCTVTARPDIPAGQTTIASDPSLKVQFVGLGMGVQNYTCNAAGTFASVGAVAKLYDVSCLVGSPFFTNLTQTAFKLGGLAQRVAVNAAIRPHLNNNDPFLLGDHTFITNPVTGTGIVPTFVFSKTSVVATKFGGVPSPTNKTVNVDWLQLNKQSGNMGTQVFRLDTVNGQPPTSCDPTSTAVKSVNYAAMYWFLG